MGQLLAWYLNGDDMSLRVSIHLWKMQTAIHSPETVSTNEAKAEVTTGQNNCITQVRHAYDTFSATIVSVFVRRDLTADFVLQSVDLLEKIAQAIDEELLFQCLNCVCAIRR